MREINTLVDHYVAVWNEPDADLRRKSITELWGEDGIQFTRSREIRGYKALEERVKAVYEEFLKTGGFVFQRAGDVQAHHHAVRFTWEMVPAGGDEVAAVGSDFFLLSDDGRICCDYQF